MLTLKKDMNKFLTVISCIEIPKKEGLIVNAGHGLNYHVLTLISSFKYNELNIGHAIIARSVLMVYYAVNTMKNIILQA